MFGQSKVDSDSMIQHFPPWMQLLALPRKTFTTQQFFWCRVGLPIAFSLYDRLFDNSLWFSIFTSKASVDKAKHYAPGRNVTDLK